MIICTKNYEHIFKSVEVTHRILQTFFGHGVHCASLLIVLHKVAQPGESLST